jgi:hypothetical protein
MRVVFFSLLLAISCVMNSYAMQCGCKIINNTVYVLMLEYEREDGKKFNIRIDKKKGCDSRELNSTELKGLYKAKKITLYHYGPNVNGGAKREIGRIDPERFQHPGVYSFWHCTIAAGVCIHAPTKNENGEIKPKSFDIGY